MRSMNQELPMLCSDKIKMGGGWERCSGLLRLPEEGFKGNDARAGIHLAIPRHFIDMD